MRAARLLALLILAAVFSMHGLQCVAADAGTTHPDVEAAHGPLVEVAESVVLSMAAAMADGVGGSAHLDALESSSAASGHPGPMHSVVHVLTMCLAVLMAGLAAMGALLLLRRVSAATAADVGALVRARSWWSSVEARRPPDLAALCLLRI
jgi:hypothetical protein